MIDLACLDMIIEKITGDKQDFIGLFLLIKFLKKIFF